MPYQHQDFVHKFSPGQIWYRPGLGSETDARIYFWNEFQRELSNELARELEQGWEVVSQTGPSAFVLRSYQKSTKTAGSYLLDFFLVLISMGIALILYLFQLINGTYFEMTTYYEPTEYRVSLRHA